MGLYNPRQTIIVTCKEKDLDNAITVSWHSPISFNPFYYGILVAGKRKSFDMIKNSKEFCVNFITEDMASLALYIGTKSGRNVNKFKEKKIATEHCEKIECLRIKDCSAYLECKLIKTIELGDHFLMVGEVISKIEGNNKKKLFQNNITGLYTFTTTVD